MQISPRLPVLAALRLQGWFLLARAAEMLMETTLLSMWYHGVFRRAVLELPGIWLVLGLVFWTSFGLARLLLSEGIRPLARQVLFFFWLVFAGFASMRTLLFPTYSLADMVSEPVHFIALTGSNGASFGHLLLIALLVLRGALLARSTVSVRSVQIDFQLGLIGLLLYGIALAPAHPREAAVGLYGYLYFGLAAMSSARIADLGDEHNSRAPRFSKGWLAAIFLTGLGVVGLALATGWVMSSRVVLWIISGFAFLMTILTAIALAVLSPVFTLLSRLLREVFTALREFFAGLGGMRLPGFLEDIVLQISALIGKALPAVIAARGFVLLAAIALIALVIVLTLRFARRSHNNREEDLVETLTGSQKAGGLRRLLDALLPRGIRLRSPGQILAAARIRQVYRLLMNLSAKSGVPRPPSITPIEFLPQLETLFPGESDALQRITSAYVQVRYGEYPETLRAVEEVDAAWERVRRRGKKK